MDNLIDQVADVIKALEIAKFTFVSQDNCEDQVCDLDVAGHSVSVGDDCNSSHWVVSLDQVKGPDGIDLFDVLSETLGNPCRVHFQGNGKALNWEPSKKVLIVAGQMSITIYQKYTKR